MSSIVAINHLPRPPVERVRQDPSPRQIRRSSALEPSAGALPNFPRVVRVSGQLSLTAPAPRLSTQVVGRMTLPPSNEATTLATLKQQLIALRVQNDGGITALSDDAIAAQIADVRQSLFLFPERCTCRTGIFGGCPCGMGLAEELVLWLGGGEQNAQATAPSSAALIGLNAVFGSLGLYLGGRLWHSTQVARAQLDGLRTQLERDIEALQALLPRLAHQALPAATADVSGHIAALKTFHRGICRSIDEQRFNQWVPGALQAASGSAMIAATAGRLGAGFVHAGVVAGLNTLAATLVTAYAALFAVRIMRLAWDDTYTIGTMDKTKDCCSHADYRDAYNSRLDAQRDYHLKVAACWTAFASAASTQLVVGALALGRVIPSPPAGAMLTLGITTAMAGLAVLYYNGQNKFTPHNPITKHLDSAYLSTYQRRQTLWQTIDAQEKVLEKATAALYAQQSLGTKLRHHIDENTQPMCGPSAFTAIADGVARQPTAASTQAVLNAVCAHLEIEVEYASSQCDVQRDAAVEQIAELQHGADGIEDVGDTGDVGLRDDLRLRLSVSQRDLSREQAHLHGLWQLSRELNALRNAPIDAMAKGGAARQRWNAARIHYAAAHGLLADMVGTGFINAHRDYFADGAWPVPHVRLQPASLVKLVDALDDTIDRDFVRVALNPHRAQAEKDAIMGLEQQSRWRTTTAGELAPVAACCGK